MKKVKYRTIVSDLKNIFRAILNIVALYMSHVEHIYVCFSGGEITRKEIARS